VHAAQAANRIREFETARDYASELLKDTELEPGLKADAHLELGLAHQGLQEVEPAVQAWKIAAKSDLGATGIHARCLLGETLFAQKNFPEAILEFTLAKNGYGGSDAQPDVDRWQAFAIFEIARCKYAQAQATADRATKVALIREALTSFEELIASFPQDALVPDAKQQITSLQKYLREN
jgi:tetratricopeptide (TPR) repeat protein